MRKKRRRGRATHRSDEKEGEYREKKTFCFVTKFYRNWAQKHLCTHMNRHFSVHEGEMDQNTTHTHTHGVKWSHLLARERERGMVDNLLSRSNRFR